MNISAKTRALLASRASLFVSTIIVFFLTLAVLTRPHGGEDVATVRTADNTGGAQRQDSTQLVQSPPAAVPGVAAPHPSDTASSRAPTVLPPGPAPQEDAAQEDMPARLEVQTAADHTSRVAFLQSNSDQPLNVSVIALDPATGRQSTVQVVVPPGRRKNLTKFGLVIEHGNRVTVQSPPYRDLVAQLD